MLVACVSCGVHRASFWFAHLALDFEARVAGVEVGVAWSRWGSGAVWVHHCCCHDAVVQHLRWCALDCLALTHLHGSPSQASVVTLVSEWKCATACLLNLDLDLVAQGQRLCTHLVTSGSTVSGMPTGQREIPVGCRPAKAAALGPANRPKAKMFAMRQVERWRRWTGGVGGGGRKGSGVRDEVRRRCCGSGRRAQQHYLIRTRTCRSAETLLDDPNTLPWHARADWL